MPRAGENGAAALALAHDLLRREDTPGSILLITDGLATADVPAFQAYQKRADAAGLVLLVLGTQAGGVARRGDGSFATGADGRRLETGVDLASIERLGVSVVRGTTDNTDLERIQRRVASNLLNALDGETCVDGECVTDDPCAGVTCGTCEECVDGQCIALAGTAATGEAFYAANGCANCHGANANDGFAPSLVGASCSLLFDKMSGAVSHNGGTAEGVTEQDAADLEAWLASLE